MNESYREHPSEEALERFLLNMSPEEELESVETHVLACGRCVDQLETLETQIAATRLALQTLETKRNSKSSVETSSSWKSWFTIPRLSFAATGAAAAAGAIFIFDPARRRYNGVPRHGNGHRVRRTTASYASERGRLEPWNHRS